MLAVALLLAAKDAVAHPHPTVAEIAEICQEAESDPCAHPNRSAHNNPNRYYFDQRFGIEEYDHIQFLRPWMAEAGWFIRWATSPGHANATDDVADVLFFTQDQQQLPRGDREYSVWLDMEKTQSRGLSGVVLYRAFFFLPAVGGDERPCATVPCGAGLDAQRVGETNQWLFRLGTKRGMSTDLFVVGVHGMLDCLEEFPASPADYERCDFIVDFDTLGLDATRNLNAAQFATN